MDRPLRRRNICDCRRPLCSHARQPLHEHVQRGDDEDGDACCGYHSPNDSGTHDLPADRTCAAGDEQGHTTKNEREKRYGVQLRTVSSATLTLDCFRAPVRRAIRTEQMHEMEKPPLHGLSNAAARFVTTITRLHWLWRR